MFSLTVKDEREQSPSFFGVNRNFHESRIAVASCYSQFSIFRLAALYNWRYKNLGNLPHIQSFEQFQLVNPGFMFNYQLIDVPDFNGIGETTPSPYFYQVSFCF